MSKLHRCITAPLWPTPAGSPLQLVATGAAIAATACVRGRATSGRLPVIRDNHQVREGPLVLPHPSAADGMAPTAGAASSDGLPCSDSREGLRTAIR